ncbi:MAG: type II secretion system protein [Candidatus Hydrogenedentes bacterium]|nr:type II secretion system protein [Candidatus Hydrogenedentota bacterium]
MKNKEQVGGSFKRGDCWDYADGIVNAALKAAFPNGQVAQRSSLNPAKRGIEAATLEIDLIMFVQRKVTGGRGGFTLIELTVVILLIGIVVAISVPQLAPVIAFSQLEGSARHLAYYGRSLVARATMLREKITLRIDLDRQEYYAVRWVVPLTEEEQKQQDEAGGGDQLALLKEYMSEGALTPESMEKMAETGKLQSEKTGEELQTEAVSAAMADKFNQFQRRATEERAKNVKHEGFLDEIGPLFEKEFSLDEVEPVEEELEDAELRRTALPAEVRLESVMTGEGSKSKGLVEIELGPLGLQEDIAFYLLNEDGDYFTVTWQAASGATGFFEGKRDL